ncbi:hypothetical protein JDV02_007173 [Purpureocillium takamizusanense]|uniref:Uncharacterized protein n=1 Tax=Purpureocillium takamizusanense TaxID=2060973 RepID=A0A9Q8QJZ6_9HYPO|nr:uncharacterized protein JDV02_007173 [Purpureocillium takamizusanense]UNI21158.1 hypothetical protein JDV02_007173 [Purpureocillium takamizusanense]
MRFTVAFASLLASTATANAVVSRTIPAIVGADVDVEVNAAVDIEAKVDALVKVGADVDVKVRAALDGAAGFKCPGDMSYCPWAKSCSCKPGLHLDVGSKKCVGKAIVGAWPEPKIDVFASKGVKLATFCAISPYKIVKYDAHHEYCQAGPNTIAFVASASILLEIEAYAHAAIDVTANVSADLKATCAGLASLYVGTVVEAVALFNTDVFALAAAKADIDARLVVGLFAKVRGLLCGLGLGKCKVDCVSYCTKGCKNFIDIGLDVDVHIGAQLEALVGLCILPNVLLICGKAQAIITVAVDGLLCLVGGLIKLILSTYNCHCH